MADNVVKGSIEIQTQNAERNLLRLQQRFESLGGQAMSDLNRKTADMERSISKLSSTTEKGHGVWSKFTQGIAVGTIAANAASKAWSMLTDLVKDSFKAALEEEKQWTRMSSAIVSAGGNVSSLLPKYKAMTDQLEMLSGVADGDISAAFAQMTRAGIDVTRQYALMTQILDIAVDKEMAVATVTDTVVKAMAGKDGALEKLAATYGITTTAADTFHTIMEKISKVASGAAKAAMAGHVGDLQAATIEYNRAKEAAGGYLTVLAGGIAKFLRTTEVAKDLRKSFEGLGVEGLRDKLTVPGDAIQSLDRINMAFTDLAYRMTFPGYEEENQAVLDELTKLQQEFIRSAEAQGKATSSQDLYNDAIQKSKNLIIEYKKSVATRLENETPEPISVASSTYNMKSVEAGKTIWDLLKAQKAKGDAVLLQLQNEYMKNHLSTLDYLVYEEKIRREEIKNNALLTEEQKQEGLDILQKTYQDKRAAELVVQAEKENAAWTQRNQIFLQALDQAFNELGNALTAFGSSSFERMEMLAQGLLKIAVKAGLDALKQIVTSSLAAAAQKKLSVAQAETAIAGSGAAVSFIPFIGPALAQAAMSATNAAIQANWASVKTAAGFDDPINDAKPLKSGRDYARLYQKGVDQGLGSPGFGDFLDKRTKNKIGGTSAGASISIQFNGDVYEATAVETLMNKFKDELYYNTNTLNRNLLGVTG